MAKKKNDGEKAAASAPWVMSPQEIVREIHTLSDELDLRPEQLAAVLQMTEDQLKVMRQDGSGPDFEKMGEGRNSPVRYKLGVVREWRKPRSFANTSAANVSRFGSMADFLSHGAMEDDYLVAKDAAGNQWEFWESIRQQADVAEVAWLPMDKVLEGFRSSAGARSAAKAAYEISDGLPPGKTGGSKRSLR